MQDTEQLAKSRKKIEALEQHARWFIDEYNAGRIIHFKDEDDLESQGFMRMAPHLVLRDEMVRLTQNVSDDDLEFLQTMMNGSAPKPAVKPAEAEAEAAPASASQDDDADADEELMEDALSEIVTLNGTDHGPQPEPVRASSMFAHLVNKTD